MPTLTAIDVSVLMPVKGRPEQTAECLTRLMETAGGVTWELLVGIDDDPACYEALKPFHNRCIVMHAEPRRGYWKMLSYLSQYARGRLLSNIANDVLPGRRWLERAVKVHDRYFHDIGGVVGYNDGLLFDAHTGHLLIDRRLLYAWYGDAYWPTMYDHLFGDTEICQRAMIERRYMVALKSVLYHNHPTLARPTDDLYAYSHKTASADEHLFGQRRDARWQ